MATRSYYSGKRVLITGGAGFLGSNLATALDQMGVKLTVLDALIPGNGGDLKNLEGLKQRYRFLKTDTRDAKGVAKAVKNQAIIFNIAGQPSHPFGIAHPDHDLAINGLAQLNLLEAVRHVNPKVKIVHCSSRQIYGRAKYLPVDETHPPQPLDPYAISKYAGEGYHRLYHRLYGLKVVVLRLTNCYGPAQNANDMAGVFMHLAIKGSPLTVFGPGNQVRDYCYVDDATNAFLAAGARASFGGEIYNVGGFERNSILEFAKTLSAIAGCSVKQVPFPAYRKAIDIGSWYADDRKFRKATGWQPVMPLKQGLKQMYQDFIKRHGKR